MDSMAAIRETFFQECEEQLGELETGLLAMEEGQVDTETVNAVFRAVHSIKGGAGAFKLDQLVRFAHTFETTLDLIRNDRLVPSSAVMKTMLRAADVLADLVRAARTGGNIDGARSQAVIQELVSHSEAPEMALAGEEIEQESGNIDFQPVTLNFSLLGSLDETDGPERKAFVVRFRPLPDMYRKGNDASRIFRELARLGDIEVVCDTSNTPELSELDPEGACFSWVARVTTDQGISAVQEIFEFVDGDCELEIEADAAPSPNSFEATSIHDEPAAAIPGECGDVARASDAVETRPRSVDDFSTAGDAKEPEPGKDRSSKTVSSVDAAGGAAPSTIRVDLERVDRLINLVGELVINQAMLSQRVFEAGIARTASVAAGLDDLEQLTREIQESVMAIRAQPVKPLFQRMSRIVREVADATGKLVRLKTEGEATEVDRTVIERLADPLTHMIRNAVDHGLERPEKRLSAGKTDHGEVRLTAAHRSGRVVIEITDDGAGINRQRVKSIAINKGLIPADASLSDSEIDNLLFLPGFSTAESVSSISGRGVGMDVVKRSIQALGGRITISSHPGQGSTFSMSLPLTLAVLDGMVVKVADQTLVVPLTAIVETLKPKPADVHELGVEGRVIANRGSFIPLIDVGFELGYRATRASALSGVAILIETGGGTRTALMVDAIQDQRQVVIKSLEANYGHVNGIAAATILGDGRIALILDVDAIVSESGGDALNPELLLAPTG